MYGVRQRVLLRHLLDTGRPIAAVARELGLHRATVHRWITAGLLDQDLDTLPTRYTPRPPVVTKLAPFHALVGERLAVYPELSAVRLLAELTAAGYTGGVTRLKCYLRTVRPQPPAPPLVRFETPPGHQAQIDFMRAVLPWGIRYGLVVVLGYSRLLWVRFYPRQDMRTVFHGLEAAFTALGGVPAEVLVDQMRAAITRDLRAAGGPLVENLEFLRFARHYGFRPRACRPYRAQTKGKVERPIRYLRENFLYGRTFLGDADLNAQAEHWLATVANVRVHATTHDRPVDRFTRDEVAMLQALPLRAYRSPGLPPPARPPRPPEVTDARVERRALSAYAALVGGES
jgi:transposase